MKESGSKSEVFVPTPQPWIKRLGYAGDISAPSSAEVKMNYATAALPPYAFIGSRRTTLASLYARLVGYRINDEELNDINQIVANYPCEFCLNVNHLTETVFWHVTSCD
jgi:hypothetical protein